MKPITFHVPGVPAPGGSKKFVGRSKKTGRAIIIDDAKLGIPWRAAVAAFGRQAYAGPLLDQPLEVTVIYVMPRPKSHMDKRGNLRSSAPDLPTSPPDVLKLHRALEDALTGIIWRDDSYVVSVNVRKVYELTIVDRRFAGTQIVRRACGAHVTVESITQE